MMWIDLRGNQHRVYYRNPLPENPRNRDYLAFHSEDDARKFIALVDVLGMDTPLRTTWAHRGRGRGRAHPGRPLPRAPRTPDRPLTGGDTVERGLSPHPRPVGTGSG
jgi:hypothetical protein